MWRYLLGNFPEQMLYHIFFGKKLVQKFGIVDLRNKRAERDFRSLKAQKLEPNREGEGKGERG